MQNFNLLEKNMIQMPSGVFAGVDSYDCYPSGELRGIKLSEKNILVTHAGGLVPAYTENHRRKNKFSVEFYKCGMVKAVALEQMQEIQTPIGDFPAELVTFYETGELKRFFPLDGKIGGMWSEQEEKSLSIPLSFNLPFASFTAIIGGIALYQNGSIRSIMLFPGEKINIITKFGNIITRNGFSLYESGVLESLEPSVPVELQTPIGALNVFDPNAIGISADINSLVFDEIGRVISLITVHNRITVQTADGRLLMLSPREVVNPLDNESVITEGLRIAFDYREDKVTFTCGENVTTAPILGFEYTISEYFCPENICGPARCAGCSLCRETCF